MHIQGMSMDDASRHNVYPKFNPPPFSRNDLLTVFMGTYKKAPRASIEFLALKILFITKVR